ncbi:MAG: InlB B-repeat-containing protein, partial [Bacteroidales bacterium]|nr:InlB B-repeat-containing protein [Bacteroidales bacterium]
MKKLSTLLAALSLCTSAIAVCPDFTNLYSPYVTAYTGYTYIGGPFAVEGVVPGRHTLITAPGTDPNTGGALSLLPAGETQVIKLGNEQIYAEAEALSYKFTVDVNNAMLLIKFAVVLEDPGHQHIIQPRFVLRVTDADGELVEACADYDVSAGAGIPGFQTYQPNVGVAIRWRDWTNVGIDLLKYVGQEVQVQFITYDCGAGGHFGYAYFTASCMSNQLQLDECLGETFTLAAPEDFESYLWSDGSTGNTATFNTGDVNNTDIYCTITAATGCQFTLYAYVSNNPGGIQTGDFTDTICEGETYTQHGFNLPPQPPGQFFYQIVIINPAACDDDLVINLYLTVVKRYNHITAAICHGENYTDNGFNIIEPPPGVWRDTLLTGNIPPDCDTYNILELTVSVSFSMPDIIEGEASPCTDELFTYSFLGSETLTWFQWLLPDNAVAVGSIYKPQITLYFTDDTPCELILQGANGCGSGSTTLPIFPRPSYHIQLNKQVCLGEEFNQYNFNLGVQNELGYFVYEKHLTSALDCDSIVILALNVLPTPAVRIEPIDPALCTAGEEITLWALLDDMDYPETQICPGNYPYTYIYDCCLTYLWNTGSTEGFITVSPAVTTTYTVTITSKIDCSSSETGCAASASQTVVVDVNEPITLNETICQGETYTAYDIIATTSGTYTTTIQTDNCDIPVTLNLTVVEPAEFLITGDICAGEPFQQYGFDFTLYQEGLFIDTLLFISAAGCDSLVIFNINVLPEKTTIVNDDVCQYATYTGNGFTLPEQNFSGLQTYTKVVPTYQGCDSTVILKLLVHPVYVNMISDEDTIGNYYDKFGFDLGLLTTAGIITETLYLQTPQGCDSTVILNLKVIDREVAVIPLALQYIACPGADVLLEIEPIADVDFYWYDTDVGGTPLNVIPSTSYTVTNVSPPQTFWVEPRVGDIVYDRVPITIFLSESCGSTPVDCAVNGTLLFREDFGGNDPADPDRSTTPLPPGTTDYIFQPSGTVNDGYYGIMKSGNLNGNWHQYYDHTYPDDPTIGYYMLVNADYSPGLFYTMQIDDLCDGSELYFSTWIGNLMKVAPGYSDPDLRFILQDAATLDVLAEYVTGYIPKTLLAPTWQQYGFSFQTISSSVILSIYNRAPGGNGNDLVLDDIEIHLCTPPVTISSMETAVCEGIPITLEGTYTDDGTFGNPLTYRWEYSPTGDDPWTTLITATGTSPLTATYTIPAMTATDEGYYHLLIGNATSIDQPNCRATSEPVELTMTPADITPLDDAICQGETYNFYGNLLTEAGEYTEIFQNTAGCDSIILLTLTVNPTYIIPISDIICIDETYDFYGQLLTDPGEYSHPFLTDAGCDSIILLTLTTNYHDITLSPNPPDGGTVSGDGNYACGTTIIVSATPNDPCYTFLNWTEGDVIVSYDADYEFTVTEDRDLVANFKWDDYEIILEVNPPGAGTVTGEGIYPCLYFLLVEATPDPCYTFVSWTDENGIVVHPDSAYSFVVTGDRTLTANFEPKLFNIITLSEPPEGGTTSGGGTGIPCGYITLTADPEDGYEFVNWTYEDESIASTDNPYTFFVDKDLVLTANFKLKEYSVILYTNPPLDCVTLDGAGIYTHGDAVTVTATPDSDCDCYEFLHWTNEYEFPVSSDPSYTFSITKPTILVATFILKTFNIVTQSDPPDGGNTYGADGYTCGEVTIIAEPIDCYEFVGWEDDDGTIVSNDLSYTFYADRDHLFTAHFALMTFTVDVSANPPNGGTVSVDNGGIFTCYDLATVTAEENECYDFVNWTKDGVIVSNNPEYKFTVIENTTLIANFKIKTFNIIVAADPLSGGTVYQSGDGAYDCDDDVLVWTIPNDNGCYEFIGWYEDGILVWPNLVYPFTVDGDRILVATYELIQFTITVSANPTDGGDVFGGGTYTCDENATVEAEPNECFDFIGWTKDGVWVSPNLSYTFTVTGNHTLIANFERKTYHIILYADPSNAGYVYGAGDYLCESDATVSAEPEYCYEFVEWQEDGVFVSNDNPYTFQVFGHHTLTAIFEPMPFTINVSANPTGTVTTDNGTGIYLCYETATVTAEPDYCYEFVNWTENDVVVSTNASYSFTVLNDRNLIANFKLQQFNVILNVDPIGKGTVDQSGSGVYDCFEDVYVWAYPDPEGCYEFVGWWENGVFVSDDNPYIILAIDDHHTLTAHFEPKEFTITVSANPPFGGTASITTPGPYLCEEFVTVEAIPNECYQFVNWTENGIVVSTNPLYTFIVLNDCTLIANFEIMTHHVVLLADPQGSGTVHQINNDGVYDCGDKVSIWADPDDCYEFEGWYENGVLVTTDNQYSFFIYENHILTAHFVLKTVTITVLADPPNGGTVTGDGTYTCNDPVTVTAVAADCYTFINWTVNGEVVFANPYTFTVRESLTLIAHFEIKTFNIFVSATPINGGTAYQSGDGVYDCGDEVQIWAIPDDCYEFVEWTDNGVWYSNDMSFTIDVFENHNFVAHFALKALDIIVLANPPFGGAVFGGGTYYCYDNVTLTAIPDSCFKFVSWTKDGEIVSLTPSFVVTVIEPGIYIANFEIIYYAVIAISSPSQGGDIIGNGDGIHECGEELSLYADPAECYEF